MLPAGAVGLWCSDSSANSFDDFLVEDAAAMATVNHAWTSDLGGVSIDSSNNNSLSIDTTVNVQVPVWHAGSRMGKGVLMSSFQAQVTIRPGFVMHYRDPSNFKAVWLNLNNDGKAYLYQRENDDAGTQIAAGTTVSLTAGNWYTMKAVIDDDPGNSALQRLRFYVDVNGNSAFDESTEKFLDTTLIDDDWSAGYMGLYRQNTVSAATLFDSFKAGFDNNADGDIDDGGDEVIIDDDFNSATVSLTYDNNGNCTDDGVFKYVYDAWNRLVGAKHRSAANATTVATYEYSGSHSRMTHVITNTGPENELGDGGERESRFRYAQGSLGGVALSSGIGPGV